MFDSIHSNPGSSAKRVQCQRNLFIGAMVRQKAVLTPSIESVLCRFQSDFCRKLDPLQTKKDNSNVETQHSPYFVSADETTGVLSESVFSLTMAMLSRDQGSFQKGRLIPCLIRTVVATDLE